MLQCSAVQTAAEVNEHQEPLLQALTTIKQQLGAHSMIMQLALGQHSVVLHRTLERDFQVAEAMFKQHIRMQELQDPNSSDLGLSNYQLATYYYSHDMLQVIDGSFFHACAPA